MKKIAFLALLLPLCSCSTTSNLKQLLGQSSYTVSVAPVALGPLQVGQVSFTVSPHQAAPPQ